MGTNKRSAIRIAGVATAAGLLVGLAHSSLWAADTGTAESSIGPRAEHVVAPGETLWSIAERYGVDRDPRDYIDDLEQLNHLGSEPIYPGEKISLP